MAVDTRWRSVGGKPRYPPNWTLQSGAIFSSPPPRTPVLTPQFKHDVTQSLGADWAIYVTNKRQGGDNGQKGVRFEDFFAAYRLAAELVTDLLSPGIALPFFQLQAEAVVDDLVVTWGNSQANYYQCKNVAAVSWTSGAHPLQEDFGAQAVLSAHQNQGGAKTTLVVPNEPLFASLNASIPASIVAHTDVVWFPYCEGKLNRIVLESSDLRHSLTQLARVDNPSDDELVNVYGALMYGLMANNFQGDCHALLAGAQSLSPHLIRLMPHQVANFALLDGFEEALASVDGLVYRLSKGFFHWEAYGTSGVFSQNCLSIEFERFQRRVVERKPTTFDDFEVLL